MTVITVTITECNADHDTTVLRARTDDLQEAIQRAIKKAYGPGRLSFRRNHELSIGADALAGPQYGQVVKPWENGHSTVTGRICITAEVSSR